MIPRNGIDANGGIITSNDDSGFIERNFRITRYLEAGETYKLAVRWYGENGIGTINVSIKYVVDEK